MHREALARRKKHWGHEHPAVANSLHNLGSVLADQDKLAEAESVYREALASRRARLPAEDDRVLIYTATLARLLAEWAWTERSSKSELPNSEIAGRAREAENLLRDCLAIRERGKNLTSWRLADVKSRLGEALVSVAVTDPALDPAGRLAKIAEAEPLLLESNDRLHQSKSVASKYKRDAISRLVRLYEAWETVMPGNGKAAQAVTWKEKMAEFDDGKAEKKPAATE